MVALPGTDFDFSNWEYDPALDDPVLFGSFDTVSPFNPHLPKLQPNLSQSFIPQGFGLPYEDVPPNVATATQPQHAGIVSQYAPEAFSSIDPLLLGQVSQEPRHTHVIDPTLHATPGLTAVPGATGATPMVPPMQGAQIPYMYPDPSAMQPPTPYFHGYRDCTQDLQDFDRNFDPWAMKPPTPTNVLPLPVPKSNKRAHSNSDSESDVPVSKRARAVQQVQIDSDSDSGKVTKPAYVRKHGADRRKSRDSGTSSSGSSSLGQPGRQTVARIGQKPQKCEDKPWVRVNTNTKGETTRTARINGEANELRKYKSKPLPHGNWESRKYTFEYTSHGGLDEFRVKKNSPRQIMEYIMEYPSDDLTLWLQVSPADMARRYGSPGHSKCLFRDCPKHVYGDSGTIDVGHYRIAFDEKFKTYGNKVVDPFDCTGYVHLYCLERFCDFASICQSANVRVDTRVDLPREASQAKWTMSGRPETELAQYFLKACRQDKLRQTDDFKNYPVHQSSSMPKPFEHTLAYALADINVQNRTRSQMRQFLARKLTPNVFMINKGDMEVAMTQKKIKRTKSYKKASRAGRAAAFDFDAHYDEYDPVINIRIAEYMVLKAELEAEDTGGRAPKKSKAKAAPARKRKRAARNDSSSESSDSEPDFHGDSSSDMDEPTASGKRTRTSPRKQARIDYGTNDATMPYPYDMSATAPQPYSYQPYAPPPTQPAQPFITQGYTPARRFTLTQLLSPSGNSLDLRNYPVPPTDDPEPQVTEPPATDGPAVSVEQFISMLDQYIARRKSSTLSIGPRGRSPRKANFNVQPVSESKVFDTEAPPNQLASPRRSSRLASRSFG
jgi:hypothetical protein